MASYVLSYDVLASAAIQDQLLAFVRNNRHVTQWVQPFAGCFLLKSDAPVTTLTGSFMDFFGGRVQHVLVPAIAGQTGGLLPQYMWDWLNRSDLPPLGGLLNQFLTAPPNK